MANSPIRSMAINGFRVFNDLSLGLSRVNLIVGKNNVGKTSLLEAIYLTGSDLQHIMESLLDLMQHRDEVSLKSGSEEEQRYSFESLFYGRPDFDFVDGKFQIVWTKFEIPGPIMDRLEIDNVWLSEAKADEGQYRLMVVNPKEDPAVAAFPGLSIKKGKTKILVPFDTSRRIFSTRRRRISPNPIVFIRSSGFTTVEIGRAWDSIALTENEDRVMHALRLIEGNCEKLAFVENPYARSSGRIIMAKLSNLRKPVPFKSLGDGINHLLGITTAMVSSKNNIILVDEIDDGIHHSIQTKFWGFIFKLVDEFQLQIFATTHSLDCIRGFQAAAHETQYKDAQIIRLESFDGAVTAVTFSADEVKIASEEDIEIR